MNTIIEDTLESRIEDIKWQAQETGWNADLKKKLTYYVMLSEIEKRYREINEL